MKPTHKEKCSMLTVEEIYKILSDLNWGTSFEQDPMECLREGAEAICKAMVRPSPSPEARVDWEERCKWLTEAMDNVDSRLTVHLLRNWDEEKRIRFCLHILGDKFQAAFEKGREAR